MLLCFDKILIEFACSSMGAKNMKDHFYEEPTYTARVISVFLENHTFFEYIFFPRRRRVHYFIILYFISSQRFKVFFRTSISCLQVLYMQVLV